MPSNSTKTNERDDLEVYFTDVEELRSLFSEKLEVGTLKRRVLFIWGIGGVGKTSLVSMFRLHCRNNKVPVGIASGDEAKSSVDILAHCANSLRYSGAPMSRFGRALGRYRSALTQISQKASSAKA